MVKNQTTTTTITTDTEIDSAPSPGVTQETEDIAMPPLVDNIAKNPTPLAAAFTPNEPVNTIPQAIERVIQFLEVTDKGHPLLESAREYLGNTGSRAQKEKARSTFNREIRPQ